MLTLSRWYGRLLDGMMSAAGLLLLFMTVMIGADVSCSATSASAACPRATNCPRTSSISSRCWPRPACCGEGQHIRIDIVLQALPPRVGWLLEWVGDVIGLVCCLIFVWYGASVAAASFFDGSISIKTLVLPEWWLLAPMPVAFALLALEFVFRMQRLALAERRPREDAVSAS